MWLCHRCGAPDGHCRHTNDALIAPEGALQLYLRIKSFCQDCVANGDMTPSAERMLLKILTDWGKQT
jgi:hypothetical protein